MNCEDNATVILRLLYKWKSIACITLRPSRLWVKSPCCPSKVSAYASKPVWIQWRENPFEVSSSHVGYCRYYYLCDVTSYSFSDRYQRFGSTRYYPFRTYILTEAAGPPERHYLFTKLHTITFKIQNNYKSTWFFQSFGLQTITKLNELFPMRTLRIAVTRV
jgi:hypothetical protein